MGVVIFFIFYASIFFWVIASVIKIIMFKTAPLHLRWELHKGGSVYELLNGCNQVNLNLTAKLKSLTLDIFF